MPRTIEDDRPSGADLVTAGGASRAAVSRSLVAMILQREYDQPDARIRRGPQGTETRNYIAEVPGVGALFVKIYPRGRDLAEIRQATEVSTYLRAGGLPLPAVVLNRTGGAVTVVDGRAVVIWEYIDAALGDVPFTARQAEQVGAVLGRIHRRLASCPTVGFRSPWNRWWERDPGAVAEACQTLIKRIDSRPDQGAAEARQRAQLEQRRSDLLTHARVLQAGLPSGLTPQLTHHDYVPANLLFSGDDLSAVIDLLGQSAFTAWELGRVALDPAAVLADPAWPSTLLTMVEAYLEENNNDPQRTVIPCARMTLLHSLFSLFGIEEHLRDGSNLIVKDALGYWDRRTDLIRILLSSLAEIEDMLGGLVRRRRFARP